MRLLLPPENRRADPPRRTARLRKSTQRESNPHFRPGEAAGCRYIMGAFFCPGRVVKEPCTRNGRPRKFKRDGRRAVQTNPEHRVGVEPTFPHYGCGVLAAERPVLAVVELSPSNSSSSHQWDQRDLNPHRPG